MVERSFKFSIDRGGTFTDVFCECGNGKLRIMKLLSEDPSNYRDAPTEGIRRILEEVTGIDHPKNSPVDTSRIQYIRMGTTVATNALLERKGERTALITTKGFEDLQYIGNQSRPKIFDLNIRRPEVLFECVEEVDERVVLLKEGEYICDNPDDVVIGVSQEALYVEKAIDEDEVRSKLENIKARGISCIAVAMMHSYTYPAHERCVERLARELGFTQISLSSTIMPMVRLVPRGCTTCVDAYLTPVLKRYLSSFCSGFDAGLAQDVSVCFMQSDGGLTSMDTFLGNRSILSGPAGGVVGYALTSRVPATLDASASTGPAAPAPDVYMPAIGFDMGGTSTDVSRYAGEFEHVFETTTAGITIQSPQLDINTVAAGGGSRLFFKNKLFTVGPESSGAHPGPICYRKNGYLAVTDANLVLGRIQPELFPSIFGPEENLPLDVASSITAFETLRDSIGKELSKSDYHIDEVAYGFIRVANEAMCRPIRNLTTMKGYDVTKHVLACFGGAGGQHCCAIAKSLGMRKIVVHRHSGILSAFGLSLADIVEERQEPCSGHALDVELFTHILQRAESLAASTHKALKAQGFTPDFIRTQAYLNIRYAGTDTAIMTGFELSASSGEEEVKAVQEKFRASYMREYGFELTGRALLVDDVRIRAVGFSGGVLSQQDLETPSTTGTTDTTGTTGSASVSPEKHTLPAPHSTTSVYFEQVDGSCRRVPTPVYLLKQFDEATANAGLAASADGGCQVDGPAMIIQDVATVVIEPGCSCFVNLAGNLEITVHASGNKTVSPSIVDPIYLSIFSHRFMGIAEQMGRTLQRTSISVNIKERLDFSCALFDCYGGLVANAPHLPVHLGAMSEAVRYQVKHWRTPSGELDITDGDVLVSNHPQLAGGSHLPDITVITPIFQEGKIVFFVASRGHHSDIGGIAPGSMPPMSKTLVQEGAAIVAFKLVEHGEFQEEGISKLLLAPGDLADNYGTRNLSDNISDLRAQVAANNRGKLLVDELVGEYSLAVVQAYMLFIQEAAEAAVRRMLCAFSKERGLDALSGSVGAVDHLDDGTPICLKISINREEGSAVFDFAGTGPEMFGNLNAPPAVTTSAVIYCLRCLLADIVDLPLNQGCLTPIRILLPKNSILNPSPTAAVVGGNVLTSQRVTDVIFRAFNAVAASQGCMNNLTFGDATMGYYETIAGGSGAGPGFHGTSGVHTHMTNTRITDPEILEKRYPVVLRRFQLREGSGGAGQFRGGDGVVRELEFMKPLTVSILSERRAFQPYGLEGGQSAQRGLNLLQIFPPPGSEEDEGRIVSLGGKNTVQVGRRDRVTIFTPGGGGYGSGAAGSGVAVGQGSGSDGGGASVSGGRGGDTAVRPVKTSGSLHTYTASQESA